eukprot:1680082-Pyramimonas_sp.AAC.1
MFAALKGVRKHAGGAQQHDCRTVCGSGPERGGQMFAAALEEVREHAGGAQQPLHECVFVEVEAV